MTKKVLRVTPILFALLAAILYALSTPFSKLLLTQLSPTLLAGLLYLGAGIGMSIVKLIRRNTDKLTHVIIGRRNIISLITMVVLDIAAPILLLLGLRISQPESVALLNNFEIVATAFFALVFFKEFISKRLTLAIILVTLASVVLSFEDFISFRLSWGALLVLAATICWGLENNVTRVLSKHNPFDIVIIKGFGAGLGSLLIALIIGEWHFAPLLWLGALLLGFVAYGFSIFLYVSAQRHLGAATTSAFYGIAPFVGALISIVIFQEWPKINFLLGLLLMIIGAYFATKGFRLKSKKQEKTG